MRTLEQNVRLAIEDFNDIKSAIEEKITILEEEFGDEVSYLRPQLKGTNTYANIIRNFSVGRLEEHIINDVSFDLSNIPYEKLQSVMYNSDRLSIKDGELVLPPSYSSSYSGDVDYSLWIEHSGDVALLNVEGGSLNDKTFVSRDVEVLIPHSELRPGSRDLYCSETKEEKPLFLKVMASGNSINDNGEIVSSSYAPEDYHVYNGKDNVYYSEELTELFDDVLRGAYPSIVRRNGLTGNLETVNKIDSDDAFYANIDSWGSFNNEYEFTNENPEILYFGPYFSEEKNEYNLPDDNRVYAVTTDAVKELGKPTIDDSVCSDDEEVRETLINGNYYLYDVNKNAYYYVTGKDAYDDGYDKGNEDGRRNGLEEGYYSGIAAGKPVHEQTEANNYLSSYYSSYSGAESDMYKDLYIWTAPTGEEGSPVGGIVQDNVTVKDVKDYFAVKNVSNSIYLDAQMSGYTLYNAYSNMNYENIKASDLVPYPYSDSYQGSYSSEDYCLFNINANRYYATVTAKTCYYSGYEAATPVVEYGSANTDIYNDLYPYDPETNTYYASTSLYDIRENAYEDGRQYGYYSGYADATPTESDNSICSDDYYNLVPYNHETNTYYPNTSLYDIYSAGYTTGLPSYVDEEIDYDNLYNYNLYDASNNRYYGKTADSIYNDAYEAGRNKGYYSGYADATPDEDSNKTEYTDSLSGCILYDKDDKTIYPSINAEAVYSKGYNAAQPTESTDTVSGNDSSLVIYNTTNNVYYTLTGADVYNAGYAAGYAAAQAEANANNEPEGN